MVGPIEREFYMGAVGKNKYVYAEIPITYQNMLAFYEGSPFHIDPEDTLLLDHLKFSGCIVEKVDFFLHNMAKRIREIPSEIVDFISQNGPPQLEYVIYTCGNRPSELPEPTIEKGIAFCEVGIGLATKILEDMTTHHGYKAGIWTN